MAKNGGPMGIRTRTTIAGRNAVVLAGATQIRTPLAIESITGIAAILTLIRVRRVVTRGGIATVIAAMTPIRRVTAHGTTGIRRVVAVAVGDRTRIQAMATISDPLAVVCPIWRICSTIVPPAAAVALSIHRKRGRCAIDGIACHTPSAVISRIVKSHLSSLVEYAATSEPYHTIHPMRQQRLQQQRLQQTLHRVLHQVQTVTQLVLMVLWYEVPLVPLPVVRQALHQSVRENHLHPVNS
jgi:hypothetical protein